MKRVPEILPISPVPLVDESLPGFVLRLADLYHFTRIGSLGIAISMPGCAFRPADIERLATRCGEPIENLIRLSYLPAPNGLRHRFQAIEVSRGALRLWPGRRYCPHCLADSPHHRAIWDLGLLSSCPVHHCVLDERCPDCARRLPWERGPIHRCRCGADLTKAPAHPASQGCTSWMGDLVALIGGSVPIAMRQLGLDASDTLHLAMTMGLMFDPRWQGADKIRNLPQHDSALIDGVIATGMEAVRGWPARLVELVEHRKAGAPQRRGVYGVAKQLGADLAARLNDLPDLPFATLIRQAVYGAFDGDPSGQFELQRSGLLQPPPGVPTGELVTKRAGAIGIGCSFETIDRLCAAGLVEASPSRGRGVPIALDVRQLAGQVAARASGITLKEASARLGLSRPRTRALLQAELIQKLKIETGSRLAHMLDPRSVSELVTALEARIERPVPPGRNVTLLRATEILKQAGVGFIEFIEEAKTGSIRPVGIDTAERGLRALQFSQTAILSFAHVARDAAPAIPVNSAARRLGLKWEVVDHLIGRKLLVPQGAGPRRSRMVTQRSLENFAERYRTGANLAKWMHTSPRHAAELLHLRGIIPVAGPRQDGCRQNIYAVADLARAFPHTFSLPQEAIDASERC